MNKIEKEVKEFYDKIQFPGTYDANDVINHNDYLIYERYLDFIEENDIKTVLDVGCGTGFVTNVLAYTFPTIKIKALDFSDSIKIGQQVGKELDNDNISWQQIDFFDFKEESFDLVLCNGSLHHMPKFYEAVQKVKKCTNKYLLVGVYNKYGKLVQQKVKQNYITKCFQLDQVSVPYETSFTHKEILEYFKEFNLKKHTPSFFGIGTDFLSLFRGKWGGFMFYYFER